MTSSYGLRTLAIHGPGCLARDLDVHDSTDGESRIVFATSFPTDADAPGLAPNALTGDAPHFYSRWSNPTVRQLEQTLAALEGAEDALAFASGIAAVSGLLLHSLSSGDHFVVSDVCYAGVAELAHDLLPRLGIAVSPVDLSDLDALIAAIRPHTRMVLAETPSNPVLRLVDIAAVAALTRPRGIQFAVESTIATPIATRPLALGADYVVHSLTKYLSGHGDVMGGVVLGQRERIVALRRDVGVHLGGVLSPMSAWLTLRGLATLPDRMASHMANALAVSAFLESHPRITRVLYPGLPSHPQHGLAQRQMQNCSGLLAFQARSPEKLAECLPERLRLWDYAVSFGHARSLIYYLATDTMQAQSFRLNPEQLSRYRSLAGDGVFRASVGLEDPADLVADLAEVLD